MEFGPFASFFLFTLQNAATFFFVQIVVTSYFLF